MDDLELDEGESRAWFIELAFWRPSKLTDKEMALFFRQRDGKWSEQTKLALKRHGARGLDLNQNWALLDQSWTCPGCRRQKTEIFRLSTRGILLAKLEEHHDHLRDYVNRRAKQLFGDERLSNAPRGAGHIIDRLQGLVTRFSQEMVCSECNSADGAVKARLKGKIHNYFSFSPSEIAGFVTPRANAPHDIDFAKAEALWERLRPAFDARLKLIDDLLALMQSGVLAHERGTPWFQVAQRQFEPQAQLHQAFLFEAERDERQRELSRTLDEFLARSVQKDSPVIAPKTKRSSGSVNVPSHAEYTAYCDPVSPRRWRETPEDWRCPVCDRQKREVIRRSNSGKWSGGVREHYQPIAETDSVALWARRRLLPGFRNVFVMSDSESVLICSGCQEVATQLKQRRQDIPDQFLNVDDLQNCLTVIAPHAPHEVDWDEATNRVLNNAAMGAAWDAYWQHMGMAAELRERFRYRVRSLGFGREKAIRELSESVMFDAQIDDQEEAIKLTTWLLEDAERRLVESERQREEHRDRKAEEAQQQA